MTSWNDLKFENRSRKDNDKIYSMATYYIALCYMHGNGVEQDRKQAIGVTKYLNDLNKYKDA
ncbi:1743_t:CDS:2 [Racocetra persica]|uniref:1743_t:CDS:1 n=1 Tax=Racocetra persica TaxID=160502 RepID=A0ACA9KFI1_9GLOM|nr:1743_t:CDS:2 [Racocetra persica]